MRHLWILTAGGLFWIALTVITLGGQTFDHRWAVVQATGEFLYGGRAPYDVVPGLSPGQIRVELPRQPDPRTERYSGNPASPFRAATTAESMAWNEARKDEQANADLNVKFLRALTQATYELKSNTWTLAQYRARLREIYKALR